MKEFCVMTNEVFLTREEIEHPYANLAVMLEDKRRKAEQIKCPKCGSSNIQTERRPDGFHHCMDCQHRWKMGESQPKPPLFDRITTSPEVLANFLVFHNRIYKGRTKYHSAVVGGEFYSREEAIAATVARLKEVAK